MKQAKTDEIPEFKTLEEERDYWEKHGPLADGHHGKLTKLENGQKRSSMLAVRLTGEELTKLRDAAARHKVGPSTFARITLTSAIEQEDKNPRTITVDELKTVLDNNVSSLLREKAESLAQRVAIGDPENPSLLVLDGNQMKETEELGLEMFRVLLSLVGVKVITPQDEGYADVMKRIKVTT